MPAEKKILIIDDEPNIVSTLAKRLEFSGYMVSTADNGADGLKKVQTENPDLILLDILMPKMDGYSFIKKLKENKKTKYLPVIVISAKAGMKELFTPEGISDYISKPFDPQILLTKIAKILKN